jgi:hypothetical protein
MREEGVSNARNEAWALCVGAERAGGERRGRSEVKSRQELLATLGHRPCPPPRFA